MELIDVKKEGDITVIKPVIKRLDASVALGFKDAVLKVIASGENALVLDLESVQFMDSSGLGAIVSVLKSLGNRGTLAVCNLKGAVLSLFKLTRMDKVFAIEPTRADAINRLRA